MNGVAVDSTNSQGMDQHFRENGQNIEKLVSEIVKTGEFRTLIGAMVPEVLGVWAGKNSLKRLLTRPVERSIRKNFIERQPSSEATPEKSVFDDPVRLELLTDQLLRLVNDFIEISSQVSNTVEGLPSKEKEKFLEKILSGIKISGTAEIASSCGRIINDIHESNDTFFSTHLKTPLTEWIERLDFDVFEKVVSTSQKDMVEIIKTLNNALWKSPEKMRNLLGIFPGLLNTATTGLVETLNKFNKRSPEWLTETMISQIQKVDGEAIGALVNEVTYILRNLQEGNEYLIEDELPTLTDELLKKSEEIASTMDTDIVMKARLNIEDWKNAALGWLKE